MQAGHKNRFGLGYSDMEPTEPSVLGRWMMFRQIPSCLSIRNLKRTVHSPAVQSFPSHKAGHSHKGQTPYVVQ